MSVTIVTPVERDGEQFTHCDHGLPLSSDCFDCENLEESGNPLRGFLVGLAIEGLILTMLFAGAYLIAWPW
jgi:hypothetical protein